MQLQILNGSKEQTMSSKEIAVLTSKRHSDVLRDLDKLITTLNADLRLGFKSTTYEDSTGKSNRMFELDKNATICLVAGYDANVRMKIINRWQELELQTQNPMSPMEMVIASAQQIMRLESRQEALEKTQEKQSLELESLVAKADAILDQSNHYSVLGYANLCKIKITNNQASSLSRKLGKVCKDKSIDRSTIVDPRFGKVFIYPQDILEEVFKESGFA